HATFPNRLQLSTPDHFFSDRPISKIPLRELFVPTISYRLHYGQSQTPVLEIIPDPTGLYRFAWPDIGLSDLANLTRCRQAALELAQHQKMIDGGKMNGARRLKSLKNFSWSALYCDLIVQGYLRPPWLK